MSVQISVEIPAMSALQNKFNELPGKVVSEVDNAVGLAALTIEGAAKRESPVDTGRMRRSITTSQPGVMRRSVAPHVHYAIYVHEGTKFIKANPFMQRAVDSSRKKVEQIFKNAIQRVLDS